jgi:hypothetical protein
VTYRTLEELPPKMASVLLRMHTQTILTRDADADHGISPNTLAALKRHGLIEEGRDKRARPVWKPSGRGLSVLSTESPRLLAARSQKGYTTRPAEAMRDEPEAVSEVWLKRFGEQAQDAIPQGDVGVWVRERKELVRALDALEAVGNRSVARQVRQIRDRIRVIDRELKAA